MNRCKTQMNRLLVLHGLMQEGKYPNCSTFSKEWEVSPKTIHRY